MTLHIPEWARRAALALTAALLLIGLAQAQTAAPAAAAASAPAKKVQPPAKDAPCLKCHDDLFEEPVVHSGAAMGCKACHGGIDASGRPHKLLNKVPSGLSSAPPELCMGCHDETDFNKKTIHGALAKGCLTCHEAHSSKHQKLLKEAVPKLCETCHKKELFQGKLVHGPVATGQCLTCHEQHASDNQGLLKKEPATLCLDCHTDIKKGPHVIAGFSRPGHPLGNDKQKVADPLRAGKNFYCASCHEPHRSERPKLTRFEPGMMSCMQCHKK